MSEKKVEQLTAEGSMCVPWRVKISRAGSSIGFSRFGGLKYTFSSNRYTFLVGSLLLKFLIQYLQGQT